jgi:hypothetical protein
VVGACNSRTRRRAIRGHNHPAATTTLPVWRRVVGKDSPDARDRPGADDQQRGHVDHLQFERALHQ